MSPPQRTPDPDRQDKTCLRLILDYGWSQRRAAERFNVSLAGAMRWVTRHRAGKPLKDRTCRTHHCPTS